MGIFWETRRESSEWWNGKLHLIIIPIGLDVLRSNHNRSGKWIGWRDMLSHPNEELVVSSQRAIISLWDLYFDVGRGLQLGQAKVQLYCV